MLKRIFVYACCGFSAFMCQISVMAQMPDNLTTVAPQAHVRPDSGALGCFRYNPSDGKIYIGLFGAAKSLRVYDPATNTSSEYVDQSTLNGWSRASDVPGGIFDSIDAGYTNPSGMMFNPVPITLEWTNPQTGLPEQIVYPANTLAYVIDGGGEVIDSSAYTLRFDWTKRMWRWDLREAWTPTTIGPDYATAQNGVGVTVGAYNQADWNDIFSVVFTQQDINNLTGSTSTFDNLARQFAWAADGSAIYFVDRLESDVHGGIYKVDPTTGAVSILWRSPLGTEENPLYNPICEPGIVHTSVLDLTGGAYTGQQILFDGLDGDGTNGGAGNYSGMSYIVDTGSGIEGPFEVYDLERYSRFAEWNGPRRRRLGDENGNDVNPQPIDSPRLYSIVVDDNDGNIYFYDSGNDQSIWRYDTEGRFVCLKTKFQHIAYNQAVGSTSTTGISMRLQMRTVDYDNGSSVFQVPQILFMSSGTYDIPGLYVFKPGDFDRDDDLDQDDVDDFLAVMATPIETFSEWVEVKIDDVWVWRLGFYEEATNGLGDTLETVDYPAYVNYIKYDLNNNGLVNGKDKLILWRFRDLAPCDYDADGDVDAADQNHLTECMGKNTTYTTLVHVLGDCNGDQAITSDDFTGFAECATGPGIDYTVAGLPGECTLVPDVDGLVAADMDRDRDIDMDDFANMQRKLGSTADIVYEDVMCGDCDLDNDDDVDTDDVNLFNGCFSGDGVPADPKCLD